MREKMSSKPRYMQSSYKRKEQLDKRRRLISEPIMYYTMKTSIQIHHVAYATAM